MSFGRFTICNGVCPRRLNRSGFHGEEMVMTEEALVKIIRKLLDTTEPLDFLLQMGADDLRVLITCIRDSKEFESEKACERRDSRWFYGKKGLITF